MGGLLLVAVVALAYLPAWRGGFLWDDDAYITANDALRSAGGLRDIWFQPGATCQYYPLSFTVFWIGYHLWGLNPLGYHLQNLLLHGLVSVLLWQVLKRLEVRAAWLAGALFALHPVNVMSVAWMTELKNTLSGALVLGAAWAYLRFAGLGVYESRTRPGADCRYAMLALGLFALAMLAKTAVSFLPVTLLLVGWWKRGRLAWRWGWPVAVMVGIALAMGWLTLHVEQLTGATGETFQMTFPERVLVSGRSFWFYLGKLVFPYPLTFIYERWKVDAATAGQWVYPAATVGLLAGLWVMRKRAGRGAGVALVHFYLATSFLVLIQVLYMMQYTFVSDHWQYFGCMSMLALAAAGLDRALEVIAPRRDLLRRAFYGVLLLTLGGLTWRQCGVYTNVETLWQTTLVRNPDCFLARNNLGNLLFQNGQITEAFEQYQKALAASPRFVPALNNLGDAFLQTGQVNEAIARFQESLEIQARNAPARNGLGIALVRLGRTDEALIQFQQAVEAEPRDVEARNNLAACLLEKGRVDEAILEFQKSLAVEPANADAQAKLGKALLQTGNADEAIAHLQKSLAVRPGEADVQADLGDALLMRSRAEEAIVHYQKSLALNPDNFSAQANLGNALFLAGRADEAILHYQSALAVNPKDAKVQVNLGNALFKKGRLTEAVGHYRLAAEIEPNNVYVLGTVARILAISPDPSIRNGAVALNLAQRAVQLSGGGNPALLTTLAAAEAETGRYSEAVQTARHALELATAQHNTALVNILENQIGLYEANQPFRDPQLTNAAPGGAKSK